MKVNELADVLLSLGVDFTIHTSKSIDEEVHDVDVWTKDFFEKKKEDVNQIESDYNVS